MIIDLRFVYSAFSLNHFVQGTKMIEKNIPIIVDEVLR
jgi:hypothetical protein